MANITQIGAGAAVFSLALGRAASSPAPVTSSKPAGVSPAEKAAVKIEEKAREIADKVRGITIPGFPGLPETAPPLPAPALSLPKEQSPLPWLLVAAVVLLLVLR